MFDSQLYRWQAALREDENLRNVVAILEQEGDDVAEIESRFCELFTEIHPVCVDGDEREEKNCPTCFLGAKAGCSGLESRGGVEALFEKLDGCLEDAK